MSDGSPYTVYIEDLAKVAWTRCRNMADRKSGATWESVTEEVRDAWRKGAKSDLTEASQ